METIDALHYGPKTVVLGLDWTEINRFAVHKKRTEWPVIAPLIDAGIDKPKIMAMIKEAGLPQQRLYRLGFPHANCGGACVKAGISHWTLLYRAFPDRFKYWEDGEEALRAELGDHSILRDRRGGKVNVLTLKTLRERIEEQPQLIPTDEWGGCGCAIES